MIVLYALGAACAAVIIAGAAILVAVAVALYCVAVILLDAAGWVMERYEERRARR